MSVPQGKHTTGFVDPGLLALPTWYNEERRISGLIVALRNFARRFASSKPVSENRMQSPCRHADARPLTSVLRSVVLISTAVNFARPVAYLPHLRRSN